MAAGFAAEGARVIVNGRSETRVHSAISAILRTVSGGEGGTACGRPCNSRSGETDGGSISGRDILVITSVFMHPSPSRILPTRIGPNHRNQLSQRSAAFAAVSSEDEKGQLGAHPFHFERVGGQHSRRDDPLRRDQDHAGGVGSRTRGDHSRLKRDDQFRPRRSDTLGRRRQLIQDIAGNRTRRRKPSRRSSLKLSVQVRSFGASHPSRKSPRWSFSWQSLGRRD